MREQTFKWVVTNPSSVKKNNVPEIPTKNFQNRGERQAEAFRKKIFNDEGDEKREENQDSISAPRKPERGCAHPRIGQGPTKAARVTAAQ